MRRIVVNLVAISFVFGSGLTCKSRRFESSEVVKSDRMAASTTYPQSEPSEERIMDDPLSLPVLNEIAGVQLKAILIASDAFKSVPKIPGPKRNIENYQIEFRQKGSYYYVLFTAHRKPSENELEGGESDLGKDVMFVIRKSVYSLAKRYFFK